MLCRIACLYGVYILVGRCRATVVQRCKIICDMSYSTLMVVRHKHRKVRIIMRPYKVVQHFCELTQRCANVRETQCNNLNRQVLPLNFEHIQKSEAT